MDLNMKVEVSVGDKKFAGTLREVLQINEGDLNNEFIKQPSTYAYFAALSEYALADVEQKKLNFSVLKANMDSEKRLSLLALGKVTESMVESAIIKDSRYYVAQENLIESERQLGILKALVQSLIQRKDMLIQLGSAKRQEMALGDFGIDINKVRNNH